MEKTIPRSEVSRPSHQDQASSALEGPSGAGCASVLGIGVYLGVLFTKSEIVRWQRIHDMFLFREAHMYVIIGVGVAVAMVSMWLIKRFEIKDIRGRPIIYKPKPYHLGVVIGGMLFGAGWAITGACPGPIYAQIGAGEWMAVLTLAGALLGMFSYAVLKPRLPH